MKNASSAADLVEMSNASPGRSNRESHVQSKGPIEEFGPQSSRRRGGIVHQNSENLGGLVPDGLPSEDNVPETYSERANIERVKGLAAVESYRKAREATPVLSARSLST